jgi:hypothetical protein
MKQSCKDGRCLGWAVLIMLSLSGWAQAQGTWNAQDYDLYAGDFDGDGNTDILYVAKSAANSSGIARSDGTAPDIAWQSWPSNFLGIQWSGNAYNVIVADFNGDGKADIFLQSAAPGNSFLLLTNSVGQVAGITQTIPESAMGLLWSADQHHIVAGPFTGTATGHPQAGLFLQATSSSGTNAIVLPNADGMFTSASPAETWTDGYLGFKWSTQNANVYAGDFNGDGMADLLIQAKPAFVLINLNFPIVVPTYLPNMNGVVLAQTGVPIFAATGLQAWSRMSNGVDWSPLTNRIVIAENAFGRATVILQGRSGGDSSYELQGSLTGGIFSTGATTLSSNISLSGASYRLIAGAFAGGTNPGVFYQALVPGGTNYVSDSVGPAMTALSEPSFAATAPAPPAVCKPLL